MTKYQIAFELGGRGSTHRRLTAAIKAARQAVNRCRRNGDAQGVRIIAIDYPADGSDPWGIERPLDDGELAVLEASR